MKMRLNPIMCLSAAVLAFAHTAQAGNLTWNNGASTGNWNTSDANWSGSTWSNSNPDNASFNNISGTVNLSEAITAGSITFNWNGYNGSTRSPVLSGSSLSVGSLNVNGVALGGGVDSIGQAYTARAQISNTTNVSGNVTVQRGMLYAYNGTLNVSGSINSVDAWNVFRADISTVSATGGINFSSIASGVELYGGTVTTPFIKVGNALWDGGTGLHMGSGVNVVATQSTSDFLQVYNNGDTNSRAAANLASGGMTLNTQSYAVTVATQLNGVGSLTKSGSGTLTINQSNNYTGGTNVSEGTLVLAAGAWTLNNVSGGGVTVGSGATLRADNSVANQLNGLTLNGGTVDAVNSSGNGDWGNYFLTGNVSASGNSSLNADVALRASNVDFNVATGGSLNVGGLLHNGAYYGIYSGAPATISKSGSGTMTISGTHTYTGATTVSGGSLVVNGNISTSSLTTVQSGASIGGSGTVGSLQIQEGASINPGNSPGILTVNGDYNQAGLLTIEVNGLTPGTQHDQVNVDRVSGNGSVTLSGGLNVVFGGGYTPVNGDMLFILLNDSTDSITGTFSGLAQNALVTSYGGYDWRISYTADDASSSLLGGNDIALYAVPETSSALLGGLGLLALLRRRRG